MVKPFLKWVGGKSDLLDKILPLVPKEINNYHEVFVGGGSLFLNLIDNPDICIYGKVYIYDSNRELINLYNCIKIDYIQLWTYIDELTSEYSQIDNKEEYYYYIRELYNDSSLETSVYFRSSLFLFLNKTGFRGLYRESRNGFNVPFGNYSNPSIITFGHLKELHQKLKNVIIECSNYSNTLDFINKNLSKGDFIYLDPPYAIDEKTDFVNYTKNGFTNENHTIILNKLRNLNLTEVKFLLSNSNINYTRELFNCFNIKIIDAKRRINSKNPNATATELLIYN